MELEHESLLRELADAHGPAGFEDAVGDIVERELGETTDHVTRDAMGNVVGTVEGDADADYEVLVAAHMDEIGFMVRHIDDGGFLWLDSLGGWNAEILRAQRVVVHTDDGPLPGIIGAEPAHTRDRDDGQTMDETVVYVGYEADEVRDRVAVGDTVTLDSSTRRLGDCVTGKALDDRVGVFAMLEAARRVEPSVTVHFAGSVQEELGLRGATALAADYEPDLAIALDGTLERSVPRTPPADAMTKLGDGVGIKAKDSTVIPSPRVRKAFTRLADEREIPYQTEVARNIGTDTGALQSAAGATHAAALSVPVRHHHSNTECAHVGDVRATVDLLTAILSATDGEWPVA